MNIQEQLFHEYIFNICFWYEDLNYQILREIFNHLVLNLNATKKWLDPEIFLFLLHA